MLLVGLVAQYQVLRLRDPWIRPLLSTTHSPQTKSKAGKESSWNLEARNFFAKMAPQNDTKDVGGG